jgi:hypothetical protein
MENTGTACSKSISHQNILEYVALTSKELTLLAQAEGLDFLAYLLDMIHLESNEGLIHDRAADDCYY